jgi:hypothetical protein
MYLLGVFGENIINPAYSVYKAKPTGNADYDRAEAARYVLF